jgi:hypothetical protein
VTFLELFSPVSAKRAPGITSAAAADAAPNELTIRLAGHLNVLREARGWSQRKLAAEIGLSPAYIGRVLRGDANIGLGMLLVIATRLDQDPCLLIAPIETTSQK